MNMESNGNKQKEKEVKIILKIKQNCFFILKMTIVKDVMKNTQKVLKSL